MWINYKKFLLILSVALCFYIHVYNLSKMNAQNQPLNYKMQKEKLLKLTEQLNKEKILYTTLNQSETHKLFEKLNYEIKVGPKNYENSLIYKQRKEFLKIMQIKLLKNMNVSSAVNNNEAQNHDILKNYIREYLILTAVKMGNLDILQIMMFCGFISVCLCLLTIAHWLFISTYFMNTDILYITSVYCTINGVILLFTPLICYPLFFIFEMGRISGMF